MQEATHDAWFLRTPRLGFRRWRAEDFPLALSLWGDPRVTALFDRRSRLEEDAVRERFERELEHDRLLGFQYWPLFLLESGEFVGCCGLKPYEPARGEYEMGFHLRPSFWGEGYATEAARAVLAYAFGPLAATSVMAGHNPENHASRRVLEKLGFRYLRNEHFPGTGMMHLLHGITRAGWRAAGLAYELAHHVPADASEAHSLQVMRSFVGRQEDPFDRAIQEGHVTASAVVCSPDGSRFGLIWHEKLGRWLQPGGHVEPEDLSAFAAAERETLEETGVAGRQGPIERQLLDVDVHRIPARGSVPEHLHHDVRYLLLVDPAEPASQLSWRELAESNFGDLDPALARALRKAGRIIGDAGR